MYAQPVLVLYNVQQYFRTRAWGCTIATNDEQLGSQEQGGERIGFQSLGDLTSFHVAHVVKFPSPPIALKAGSKP